MNRDINSGEKMIRRYEKILSEIQEKSSETSQHNFLPQEADPNDPDATLGAYAFAPQRKRKRIDKGNLPDEPNTDYENILYQGIYDHLLVIAKSLDPMHTDSIKTFMRKNMYQNIFIPPKAGLTVYRGQAMSVRRLKNIIGPDSLDEKGRPDTSAENDIDYLWVNPKGENFGSSWTTDFQTAKDFSARDISSKRPVEVIMTARVAPISDSKEENKFVDVNNLYRIVGGWAREKEILALTPVRIHYVQWQLSAEFWDKIGIRQLFM